VTGERNVLSLETALLPPLFIEIGGTRYPVKKITRPLWRKIKELEDRRKQGDVLALYEQIELVIDAPAETIDGLDVYEVRKINDFITDALFKPLKNLPDEEKKEPAPGPTTPQI
jgi:hypothetical protein